MPERAVPVLEKAVSLLPEDRRLRAMLAEGLREEGRLDEAGTLLEELIGGFGRRRSPERAAAHLELARVRRDQGRMDEAIVQLDTASKMDPSNVRILKTLAELARENEELDRAERAYRTLLMTVRRAGDDVVELGIGPAGALLELSRIADSRGQDKQAEELLESALESLAQDDTE
ncbi:MAG: tetratricopeptide repeat protein, partial [Pseudomonadota bacterium]